LRARLGIDGQVDDGVVDRFVRRRALAGPDREDQALPTDRPADRGLETQRFRRDLVQRLQHRHVVAGAADRLGRRLLRHLLLWGRRRGDFIGLYRGSDGGDGRRHRGWGGLFGRGACDRRHRGLLGGLRGRRRRLGGHHPGHKRAQRDPESGPAKDVRRGLARAHGYSGVQAS
jgi:hypothetical protein